MKVLVTGGTGFIGSTLVRYLIAAGHEVRVLVRQRKDSFLLENLKIEVANGDVTSAQAVERAVQGCDVVFNLASLYAFYPFWMKDPKAIYKINVEGTVNVLEASLKHGVKKFIHTSTIAAIGARPDGKPSDESAGFEERGASHYARSKYQAEQEVLKYFKKGLPAVILNPAIVIGERDHKPTPSGEVIVKFLNRKYPGYFDALWSVADADDVARAHIAAVERGRNGERYILANSQPHTFKKVFQLLEKVTGISAPCLKIPYGFLLGFTYLDEVLSYFIFRRRPLLPVEGVKFSRMSIAFDNSKAVRELGYTETPFEETLKKAVSWYRKNAYIEPRGIFRIRAHGSRTVRWIMRRLGMDTFTDKLNPGTLLFFGVVKLLGLLRKMGAAKGRDGWRTVTQSYLRTEQSKFSLTAFNLDFWSDMQRDRERTFAAAKQHCLERLARFLKRYSVFHAELQWGKFCAKKRLKKPLDIVAADFDVNGDLRFLEPHLDPDADREKFEAMPVTVKEFLIKGIIQVYNKTKDLADKKRPLVLKRELGKWVAKQSAVISREWRRSAADYAKRILSAVFIQFESAADLSPEGSERFRIPPFIKMKHPGFGILSIVCRFYEDLASVDLWVQFSHIALDGVPAQEILNELKEEWGVRGDFLYPACDDLKEMSPELSSTCDGKGGIFHVHQFLDFQPFLRVRNELNKRFGGRAKEIVTAAALLIWKLAQYPEFEDVKFSVPVDVRAMGPLERTLGLVLIRPSTYFDPKRSDRGFFEFQREFNRQLFSVRKRRSEGWQILDAYAAAPPILYALTSKFLLGSLQAFCGAVGISIIKKSDFFIAPNNDGHTGGFIAFSSFSLPSRNGSKVCVVSIKGTKEKAVRYMNVLQDVMHRAIQHDELYF